MIIGSGSTKGYDFIGSLNYLYDYNYISKDIECYYGTSVGSLITILLFVGYTPKDLKYIT